MPHTAALPFFLKRAGDAFTATTITSTREIAHGLLILRGDRLVIQWRVARKTERVGLEIRTDEEIEPVKEIEVPIEAVAGAMVRGGPLSWLWGGPHLVLTATDLRAFEGLAGVEGLKLEHPARLLLRLRLSDRLAAEEFSAELALAVAEAPLRGRDEQGALTEGAGTASVPLRARAAMDDASGRPHGARSAG